MNAETRTAILIPDAAAAFAHLVDHLCEQDIEHETLSQSHTRFTREGCRLDFSHGDSMLTIEISAPDANMLYFLKEAMAAHVGDIDSASGHDIVWEDAFASSRADGTPFNFHELTLVRRREILPGMIRLTFSGEDVTPLAEGGLHVKLMRPAIDSGAPPQWPGVASNGVTLWPQGDRKLHVRYFTIRHARPRQGEVDIDVVQHAGGMISDWALKAAPGDVIGVMGPAGDAHLPHNGGPILLAGDETALPAIARILEALPQDQDGTAIIAMADETAPQAYLPSTNLDVTVLAKSRFQRECVKTAEAFIRRGQRYSFAWFGGEAENANAMRRLFKEGLGLGKGGQLSVAYWQKGKRGRADTT